jgi:hypothetical protein
LFSGSAVHCSFITLRKTKSCRAELPFRVALL